MKELNWKTVLLGIAVVLLCIMLNIYLVHRMPIPEEKYMKTGIVLLVMELGGLYYMITYLFDDGHYKAEMVQITPDIRTPAPFGQGQHGSARWLRKKEFSKVYDSCVIDGDTNQVKAGGLVIGKEDLRGEREKIYYIGNDTHSLTVGSTRSGKTRCEVLQTIGLCGLAGESMLITDIKGELHDYTASYLKELGYEVKVIDYDEQILSDDYNLLQPVIDKIDEDDIPGAIDECWDIVSQMVGEAKGERIWTDGECCAIAGSIMAVCYDNRNPQYHKYRNMTNVYYFLVEMCTSIGSLTPIEFYLATIPQDHPCRGIFAVAKIAPYRTRSSFYTSAIMTLRMFTNPNLYSITKSSCFQPEALGREKMAVYIILPEDRTTYNSIATLFIMQVYSRLSRLAKDQGGRLPVRVEMVWDEFGNFAKIPNFIQMLTVAGGKGIRFHLFLQDYAQLDTIYERDAAKTIRNNCETKVYLRSADGETRKQISDELDDYTTKGYSLNYNKHQADKSSTSSNLVGRKLLTSEEVGKIKRPYSLVMRTSDHPAILYAPDLSKWSFNDRFGMGSETHNQELRMERHAARPVHENDRIELWGIWKKYQDITRTMLKKKAQDNIASMQDDD